MAHRLDPLLNPRSIAVLGASEKPGVGRQCMENLLTGGYTGALYAVNPGYETVLGVPCFPSLSALPEAVEHVIFTIGDRHVEAALDAVIEHGARAATLMSQLVLENDQQPRLLERVRTKILDSGLVVCGANAMGFYNCADGVWACGFDTRNNHPRGGNVTLISHSGSGMSGIVDCEERIDFNLAVSTGQELTVSMDEYMDYALEQTATRVIGLFMETVRHPDRMRAVLHKAAQKNIPVVALKVGRTELAAKLAVSHSGAIAGSDAAYEALFDRYGVQRVDDMDELATTLIMFAQPHPVGAGGLVAIHDSGGERQLLIDLATHMQVPLAEVSPQTTARLEELLDPGLPPVNPVDAWGAGGPGADRIMQDCLAALMADPACSVGAVVHDRAPHGRICKDYIDYMRVGHAASGKPVFLMANRQGSGEDGLAVQVTREGFPVIDGLRPFLTGLRCLFAYRDFRQRYGPFAATSQEFNADAVSRWRKELASGRTLGESNSLALLSDFGLPVNPAKQTTSKESTLAAARGLGYPVVLKTAARGVAHKTELHGIHLGIHNDAELASAWDDLDARLGPEMLVAPMVTGPGREMVLGMVRDEQFGPLVMLGIGGVNLEIVRDVAWALPPFDPSAARRLVDSLRFRALLDSTRGQPGVDVDGFCNTAAIFSALVAELTDVLEEIDINPLIVTRHGVTAVDALVVGRNPGSDYLVNSENTERKAG